jgi:type IV fimbrial biogenesis protein FimT
MSDTNARFAMPRLHAVRGFTMVELVITMAIVAILAAMALPNFREFLVRTTVTDNANDLIGALNTARAEAVKRGRPVSVIANGGNWDAGWQVVAAKELGGGGIENMPTTPGATQALCNAYVDNGVNAANTTELCPRWRGALPTNYTIAATGIGAGASNTQVTFDATGALKPIGSSFNFSVCRPVTNSDATKSRAVNVTSAGVITSRRGIIAPACP